MKKRHILTALLCAAAVFTLTSCGGNQQGGENPPVETTNYTVTFNSNGGSTVSSQTITENNKANKPTDPTREGYTFGGWYTDAACTTAWNFDNAITADLTLYAKWTENQVVVVKYTVTFNSNGGSTVNSISVEENKVATQPTNPTKDGFIFGGWYKDAACTTAWDFNNDKVTADVTLYAKWTERSQDVTYFTVTFNSMGGSAVSSLELEQYDKITAPGNPTKDGYTFDGWYFDEACTNYCNFAIYEVEGNITLYAKWNEVQQDTPGGDTPGGDTPGDQNPVVTLVFNNGNHNGTAELVFEDGGWYISELDDPKKDYFEFVGWYTDEEGTNKFNKYSEITESITLYAIYETAYETISTPFDYDKAVAQLGSKVKTTSDITLFNKYTLGKGCYVEGSYINTQGKTLTITVSGENNENVISFYAAGASTSAATEFTFYNSSNPSELIDSWSHKNKEGDTHTFENLPAGTYVLTTSVSAKIESLTVSESLPLSPTSGIELNELAATLDFLVGSDFSTEGLTMSLVYENGRKDSIDVQTAIANSRIKIYFGDEVAPTKLTTPGVYTVKLVYAVNATLNYEDTYTITVYAPEKINIYDHTMDDDRITHLRQDVYKVGGTLDTSNLVVKAACLKTGSTTDYIEFMLPTTAYTVSTDLTTAGKKDVTVSYTDSLNGNHTASYSIEVINVPDTSTLSEITITVDNTITAAVVDLTNGIKFATINQALQFLDLCTLSDSCEKVVALTAGQTYNEKVEITIPNLTLKTVGATGITDYAVIEYGALNGLLEPGESQTYSTDGSATVSIREDAVGFTALNVYFKNVYNTLDEYNASKLIAGNGTQAVACLVQADLAHFNACAFSSYQDTLYAQVGRHYFENCYIEGRTDYIFGEDATSYFTNCTIHSILGDSENNGGYVATTKGSEGIKYNYIFDGCTFTAAEEVTDGSVSIARGWAENMTLIVMNSVLGPHISKEAYGDSSSKKNDRYGKMNADPVANQILEYNNTGDGAITASLANTCTVLTSDNVNQYIDLNLEGKIILSQVYTKDNGATTYSSSWAGPYVLENVTINLYNRLNEQVATYKEFAGNYFITPANLYEAGHHFVGWYTDEARTTEYDDTVALTDNQVLNLYAKYDGASSDHTFTFDMDPLKTLNLADSTPIEQSHLTGNNSFLTKGTGTVTYRKNHLDVSDVDIYYIEVKNEGFKIEFEGAGTITITFASTGSSNASRVGIVDEDGNYADGVAQNGDGLATPVLVTSGDEAGAWEVTGTTYAKVTFTVTKPGTYYIMVPSAIQSRAARIESIVMVDNF